MLSCWHSESLTAHHTAPGYGREPLSQGHCHPPSSCTDTPLNASLPPHLPQLPERTPSFTRVQPGLGSTEPRAPERPQGTGARRLRGTARPRTASQLRAHSRPAPGLRGPQPACTGALELPAPGPCSPPVPELPQPRSPGPPSALARQPPVTELQGPPVSGPVAHPYRSPRAPQPARTGAPGPAARPYRSSQAQRHRAPQPAGTGAPGPRSPLVPELPGPRTAGPTARPYRSPWAPQPARNRAPSAPQLTRTGALGPTDPGPHSPPVTELPGPAAHPYRSSRVRAPPPRNGPGRSEVTAPPRLRHGPGRGPRPRDGSRASGGAWRVRSGLGPKTGSAPSLVSAPAEGESRDASPRDIWPSVPPHPLPPAMSQHSSFMSIHVQAYIRI